MRGEGDRERGKESVEEVRGGREQTNGRGKDGRIKGKIKRIKRGKGGLE